MQTRRQKMAQQAAQALRDRDPGDTYGSYAKSFPALLHTAGLCQAVAFLQVKCPELLKDLIRTIGQEPNVETFAERCRSADVPEYMHLSRICLDGATWLKRYVEAREKQDEAARQQAVVANGSAE